METDISPIDEDRLYEMEQDAINTLIELGPEELERMGLDVKEFVLETFDGDYVKDLSLYEIWEDWLQQDQRVKD